jgi:hypothetical protein
MALRYTCSSGGSGAEMNAPVASKSTPYQRGNAVRASTSLIVTYEAAYCRALTLLHYFTTHI